MKKLISLLLLTCLIASALVSCGGYSRRVLKIGVSVESYAEEGAVSVFAAGIVTDRDGKIQHCVIDAVDYTAALAADTLATPELNMASDGASWETDAAALESALLGKTRAEIEAMEDLEGSQIAFSSFKTAVLNAYDSPHAVSFRSGDNIDLGLGFLPTATAAESGLSATMDGNMSAVVMSDGRVVSAIIDSYSITMSLAVEEGELVTDSFTYAGTKLEQYDNYGMVAYANAIAEWYAQAQTFANTAIGKTAAELIDLPPSEADETPDEDGKINHPVAGCTMKLLPYKPALIAAAASLD